MTKLYDELKEKAEKATPGPWTAIDRLVFIPLYNKKYPEGQVRWCPSLTFEHQDAEQPNAELIAALRNNLPAILSALKDSERYRWLRDEYTSKPFDKRTALRGPDLDAAIDAAQSQEDRHG